MTPQEELQYLFGIVTEASNYESSDKDNIRLEVESRIQTLINAIGSTEEAPRPRKTAPVNGERKIIRLRVEGHNRCVPIEDCEKIPCSHSRFGYQWKLKEDSPTARRLESLKQGTIPGQEE